MRPPFEPPKLCGDPLAAERKLAAWTFLCGLLLWTAMCVPFFQGRVYTSDDLGVYHLPLRHFYAQCLARGEAFDWCPQLYGGFYLSGEGQVGMYHPLHWLLYRFLDLHAAFDLELLLSYPLLLIGMYLFLRRHVASRAAAMFGAVVFTFSGFNTLHFVHPHAIAITAHLPWLLWCWHMAWREAYGWWHACGLTGIALLTASQILLGYPQYVWFSFVAEALYVAFLWRLARPTASQVAGGAVALVLGGLAGTLQWLPTWDWLVDSQRQEADFAFAMSGSLHPLNVVQLIAPYLFQGRVAGGNTHEEGLYLGAAPLVLIVWLFARGDAARHSPFFRFALILTGLAFVLALGASGGLYVLQTWLPVVGKFRLPARYLMLVHFGLAIIAAVAWARLLKTDNDEGSLRQSFQSLGKLALASVVVAVAVSWLWERERLAPPLLRCAGPALVLLAIGSVSLCVRRVRGTHAVLAALAVLDLGAFGLTYAVYPNTVRLHDYLAAGAPPKLTTGYRIAVETPGAGLRTGNHLMVRGYAQADGYAGLEPRKQLDYRQTAALQVAGVQWVLAPDRTTWTEVPAPLPRVRLVGQTVVSTRPAEDLAGIDVSRAALVEKPLDLQEGTAGRARLIEDHPGALRIAVEAPGRQLLLVAESFHRGWQAQIDGRPAEVLRVNGDFMGCIVGPGKQEVRLAFQPASLVWGRRLSLAGLLGIAVGFAFLLCPRPNRGQRARASLKAETLTLVAQET